MEPGTAPVCNTCRARTVDKGCDLTKLGEKSKPYQCPIRSTAAQQQSSGSVFTQAASLIQANRNAGGLDYQNH